METLKNMSDAQINEIENQIAEYRIGKSNRFKEIKSFEDAFKKVNQLIESAGPKESTSAASLMVYCQFPQAISLPKLSQSRYIYAACKLTIIAEALNSYYEGDDTNGYFVWDDYTYPKLSVGATDMPGRFLFTFKSKAIAEYAIELFEELFYDYFLVERN